MARQLRALIDVTEDLSSVSRTLIRWLTTTCNLAPGDLWPLSEPESLCACPTNRHIHMIKKKKKKNNLIKKM